MDLIGKRIKTFTTEKDESIRLSSLRRDAALFTAARLGTFKQATQQDFIEELQYWLHWLEENVYRSPQAIAKEHEVKMRQKEIKDPLNHIDVDMPVVSSSMETSIDN